MKKKVNSWVFNATTASLSYMILSVVVSGIIDLNGIVVTVVVGVVVTEIVVGDASLMVM